MPVNLSTFSSNKKRWLKVLAFVLAFAVFVFAAGEILEKCLLRDAPYNWKMNMPFDELNQMEPDTMDVLFLGSSHATRTFNPALFEEARGVQSMNLGTPGQGAFESIAIYSHVRQTQSPKVVVYELYFRMFEEESFMKQLFVDYIIPYFSPETIRTMRQNLSPGYRFCYDIKLLRYQTFFYADVNSRVKALLNGTDIEENEEKLKPTETYCKGFYNINYSVKDEELYDTNNLADHTSYMLPSQLDLLKKFLQVTQEDNVTVVLVTAPLPQPSLEQVHNYGETHDTFAEIAEEYGVPYFDYNVINQEEKLVENNNFRDDNHLNNSGAEIISHDLIRRLNELWDGEYPWEQDGTK